MKPRLVSPRRLALAPVLAIVLPVSLAAQEPSSRRGTGFARFENLSVAPAEKNDFARLTDAGILGPDGAGALIVTVAGELKGRADREGAVGVLLLPDLPPYDAAFRTRRALLPAGEAAAAVHDGESGYFASRPERIDAAFPRYRILLYNTTGTVVSANVFVSRVR